MIEIPDYIVLDFLEWLAQNCNKEIRLDTLLNDRDLVTSYAEKYLNEEYKAGGYKICKQRLKRFIEALIDSKEFDEFMEHNCRYRYEKQCSRVCLDYCIDVCYHDFIHFFKTSKSLKCGFNIIEPYYLVQSLDSYINRYGIKDNPKLLKLMLGSSFDNFSDILNFIEWIKDQEKPLNLYKMPEIVFNEIINTYELDRGLKLSAKSKKEIKKCFIDKSETEIYDWLNKLFGRNGKKISYIFERYYHNKAKYKCIILPVEEESGLNKFIKKYWTALDAASEDYLDIFYSFKEARSTGFSINNKIKELNLYADALPCIVIWKDDISNAISINIKNLDHSDLCTLLQKIISCIQKNMNLEQIYKEALKMSEKLKDESKMIQKIEQNIEVNKGSVTGINNGKVETYVIEDNQYKNSDIQDIQMVKDKFDNTCELNPDMKAYMMEILNLAEESISENDSKLKDECVNKFNGFIAGVGRSSKAATVILNIIGSIASIASFFGLRM